MLRPERSGWIAIAVYGTVLSLFGGVVGSGPHTQLSGPPTQEQLLKEYNVTYCPPNPGEGYGALPPKKSCPCHTDFQSISDGILRHLVTNMDENCDSTDYVPKEWTAIMVVRECIKNCFAKVHKVNGIAAGGLLPIGAGEIKLHCDGL